jgi:hypothetical protein
VNVLTRFLGGGGDDGRCGVEVDADSDDKANVGWCDGGPPPETGGCTPFWVCAVCTVSAGRRMDLGRSAVGRIIHIPLIPVPVSSWSLSDSDVVLIKVLESLVDGM